VKAFGDIVNEALALEREGAAFYRQTAQEAHHPLVAATFEFLAREEDKHIAFFSAYAAEGLAAAAPPADAGADPREEIKKIFDERSKQDMRAVAKASENRVTAYDRAMAIEQRSFDLYKGYLSQVAGETEKKLLSFLCEQENDHFKILQESRQYLDSPAEWFQQEERWMQT